MISYSYTGENIHPPLLLSLRGRLLSFRVEKVDRREADDSGRDLTADGNLTMVAPDDK